MNVNDEMSDDRVSTEEEIYVGCRTKNQSIYWRDGLSSMTEYFLKVNLSLFT